MPLLGNLVDEMRREGHGLRRRVVEGPENVPTALARGDCRVEADTDHPDRLLLLEHGHAGDADVREIPAFADVDLVLDQELLGLAPAHVRLRLVVGDHELDRPAIDPAGLVDPIGGQLRADQRGLAARGREAGQRLEDTDLVRLRLPKRLAPRRGHEDRRAHRAGRGRGKAEEFPSGRLPAPPHVTGPGLVVPSFGHC